MGTLTKTELDKITYVVLEVELNRIANEKIIGSFIGYKPLVSEHTQIASKDEMFLWLAKGDKIHILSLDHYKITDIRIGQGIGSSRTLCTKFWASTAIIDELSNMRDSLIARGWSDGAGLIDASRFTTMSMALKEEVEGKSYIASGVTSHNRSGSQTGVGYSPPATTTTYYKKKEVSTTILKRTTRYNVVEAILAMHEKIESIRNNKYEPPKIKILEDEKKVAQESTSASASKTFENDYDDPNYPWAGMC